MSENLTETEARIVGALVEKQLTTPEYYPLTLNALVAACNQKTNREPVVALTEEIVSRTLEDLRDKNLVYVFYGSTSRVPKYKHMLPQVYELEPPEVAVVCVLMLRGAQTLGELRERTGRLYEFSGLGEVSETLDNLIRRDEPLVIKLERQARTKRSAFRASSVGRNQHRIYRQSPRSVGQSAKIRPYRRTRTRTRKLEKRIQPVSRIVRGI